MEFAQMGKSPAVAVGDLEMLPNLILQFADTETAKIVLYPSVTLAVPPTPIVPVNRVLAPGLVGTNIL